MNPAAIGFLPEMYPVKVVIFYYKHDYINIIKI